MEETPDSIRAFWFGSHPDDAIAAQQQSKLWWSKHPDTESQIRDRFGRHVQKAADNALAAWADTPRGLLALVLLTDQFPRSIFRGTPRAFELDGMAQAWCQTGLARGIDCILRPIERVFLYLPLEHSESPALQQLSVRMFTRLYQQVPAEQMDTFRRFLMFALRHRRIVDRFGRFPHRNQVLGRESTPEEEAFLQEPGSGF